MSFLRQNESDYTAVNIRDVDAELPQFRPTITTRAGGGFIPKRPVFHDIYNRAIGTVLFLLASPVLAVLTLIVLLVQGRPIFYGGERLGRNRASFEMYKFRSLQTTKAQVLTQSQVLPRNSNIETRMGKFLRASRLDELPQLWNVVRGDMNIIGPRPVRPVIASMQAAENPNYEIRFAVKPGLMGPTQAYACHGTSKRIRARLNYSLCSRPVSYRQDLAMIARVGLAVVVQTARLILKRITGERNADKMEQRAAMWSTCLELSDGRIVPVSAFDDYKIKLTATVWDKDAVLVIHARNGLRRAKVELTNVADRSTGLTHVITPKNDVAEHLIARYLMDDAVVAPLAPRKTDAEKALRSRVVMGERMSGKIAGPAE